MGLLSGAALSFSYSTETGFQQGFWENYVLQYRAHIYSRKPARTRGGVGIGWKNLTHAAFFIP